VDPARGPQLQQPPIQDGFITLSIIPLLDRAVDFMGL
jgi:hypothetical protein